MSVACVRVSFSLSLCFAPDRLLGSGGLEDDRVSGNELDCRTKQKMIGWPIVAIKRVQMASNRPSRGRLSDAMFTNVFVCMFVCAQMLRSHAFYWINGGTRAVRPVSTRLRH